MQGEVDNDRGQPLPELSAHPRTLYDLLIKYELGLGGRESARPSRHENEKVLDTSRRGENMSGNR